MKKHIILTLGVALVSPLLMAQNDTTSPTTAPKQTLPTLPQPAGTTAVDKPVVDGPNSTENGGTSGAIRQGGNSVGATGNPNDKSASTRTRASNTTDFGSLDSNSDGRISQDEIRVNAGLSGGFKKADANKDGSLSQGEFSKLEQGTGGRERSAGSTGDDTEGSDRTDKDDDVSKRLPGG